MPVYHSNEFAGQMKMDVGSLINQVRRCLPMFILINLNSITYFNDARQSSYAVQSINRPDEDGRGSPDQPDPMQSSQVIMNYEQSTVDI